MNGWKGEEYLKWAANATRAGDKRAIEKRMRIWNTEEEQEEKSDEDNRFEPPLPADLKDDIPVHSEHRL